MAALPIPPRDQSEPMNRNQTVLKTRESSEDRVHIYENISVHDLGRSSDSKIKASMAEQNDGEVVH